MINISECNIPKYCVHKYITRILIMVSLVGRFFSFGFLYFLCKFYNKDKSTINIMF